MHLWNTILMRRTLGTMMLARAARSLVAPGTAAGRGRALSAKDGVEIVTRPGFTQVLFVEMGYGADQHGQNATKACVRAARNAIEFNSIPSIRALVPGGYDGMKLAVDVAVPEQYHAEVDLDAVAAVFPYGNKELKLQGGGAEFSSGIAIPSMGDKGDAIIVALCSVTVGY